MSNSTNARHSLNNPLYNSSKFALKPTISSSTINSTSNSADYRWAPLSLWFLAN